MTEQIYDRREHEKAMNYCRDMQINAEIEKRTCLIKQSQAAQYLQTVDQGIIISEKV